MKRNSLHKFLVVFVFLSLIMRSSTAIGADGSWIVDGDGSWTDPQNWRDGIVASGPGSTAYFTNDITGIRTVNVPVAQEIGNLVFGDGDSVYTPGGWVLTGASILLTNAARLPVIEVSRFDRWDDSSNDVRIVSSLVSKQGVVKRGPGTLTLAASNQIGDSVILEEGLILPFHAAAMNIPADKFVVFRGGGIRVLAGAPACSFRNKIEGSGWIVSTNGNYDNYNGPFEGSGTIYIHSSARLTLGGGSATAFASFSGEIDLANSASGNNTRINLGSTSVYDLAHLILNTGTNGGRFSFRTTTTPTRVKIGALKGGPGCRFQSSEQGGCTSLYWEIGYLNLSTVYEGRIEDYTSGRVGHLVKVGTGKLTLRGAGNYTGMTIISNGVLALAGTATLTGPTNYILVMQNAVFDVSDLQSPFGLLTDQALGGDGAVVGDVVLYSGTLRPGVEIGVLTFSNNLAMYGDGSVTNVFEIAGPGIHDSILVGGDLIIGGRIVVKLVPKGTAVIPNGIYPLFKWNGSLSGDIGNLILELPPQPGSMVVKLDALNRQIYLEVSGVPEAAQLIWRGDGVRNAWDLITPNWWDGLGMRTFRQGDIAIFDDTGSNNVPVDILIDVSPKLVFVNSTKNYTFASTTGNGIVGGATLVKSNTGTLYIFNDNAYSGPTIIGGGCIQVGHEFGTGGTLGLGPITNCGVLIYKRSDTVTNSSLITGTGVLVQAGFGTLALSGANMYTGGTVVSNGGTLLLLNPQGAGTGIITLAGGTLAAGNLNIANRLRVTADSLVTTTGTLQLNTDEITGSGTLSLAGTIRFNSPNLVVNCPLVIDGVIQSYNVTGTQIFNGVISGSGVYQRRWTDSNPANTGTTIFNAQNTYSGGTLLREGSIGFGVDTIVQGGVIVSGPIGTGPLNQDNATYTAVFAHGGPRTVANDIMLNPAGQALIIKGEYPLTLSGQVDLGGSRKEIRVESPAVGIMTGNIVNGELIKTGDGVLFVDGYNAAYSNTVVGGVLGGVGVFEGPLTVLANGVLDPGHGIGTITLRGDLILGGTLRMELDRSNPHQKNDAILVSGMFSSANGRLEVTNSGPMLAVGDTFQLFDRGRTFAQIILPTNDYVNRVKYSWNNRIPIDGRIIVTAVEPLTATYPTNITAVVRDGVLELSWPQTHIGWTLQTNSVNVADPAQWYDYPPETGSRDTNKVNVQIMTNRTNVFFRLLLK